MRNWTGSVRRRALEAGHRTAQVLVVVCILAVMGLFMLAGSGSDQSAAATPMPLSEQLRLPFPTITPVPSAVPTWTAPPTVTPVPPVPRIGIVAGHWWLDEEGQPSLDVGGVCDEGTPDQLIELDINLEVAQRVVFGLERAGYQADLLQEWDERLYDYQAEVLLSVHADACLYPEASGFKVARVADSQVPEIEDRLVNCVVEMYGRRTGLAFHEGSITPDMTRYHTFYEIAAYTPGAIIEVGFMLADRELLTGRPDLVSQGIIDGILCFLEGEGIALE